MVFDWYLYACYSTACPHSKHILFKSSAALDAAPESAFTHSKLSMKAPPLLSSTLNIRLAMEMLKCSLYHCCPWKIDVVAYFSMLMLQVDKCHPIENEMTMTTILPHSLACKAGNAHLIQS